MMANMVGLHIDSQSVQPSFVFFPVRALLAVRSPEPPAVSGSHAHPHALWLVGVLDPSEPIAWLTPSAIPRRLKRCDCGGGHGALLGSPARAKFRPPWTAKALGFWGLGPRSRALGDAE